MPQVSADDLTHLRTFVAERKHAYQITFSDQIGKLVLQDLEKFCRGGVKYSAFDPDPRIHAALEGRRETYNRIRQHLDLPLDDLVELYAPEAYRAMRDETGEDDA